MSAKKNAMDTNETIEKIALDASSTAVEKLLSELPAELMAVNSFEALQEIKQAVQAQIQSNVRSNLQWLLQGLRLETKKIELPTLLDVSHQRLQAQ